MNSLILGWVLVLEIGISGWGVAMQRTAHFDTKQECLDALKNIRHDSSSDKSNWIAYCRPEERVNK